MDGGRNFKAVISDSVFYFHATGCIYNIDGDWRNDKWYWGDFGVSFSQQRFVVVAAKMEQMQQLLRHHQPVSDSSDNVVWIHDYEGFFAVKDNFSIIRSMRCRYGPREEFNSALKLVWRLDLP